MPVKKTTSKKTTTKKTPIKKTVAKKPTAIVETKRTEKPLAKNKKSTTMKIVILVLLLLNLIFSVINFAKKDGALEIEQLKVGGAENFKKVMELYNSDFYKDQQTSAIQQFMGQ